MDTIESMIASGVSREEVVLICVSQLNMTEDQARFMIAMSLGEIDGDLVEVTDQQ